MVGRVPAWHVAFVPAVALLVAWTAALLATAPDVARAASGTPPSGGAAPAGGTAPAAGAKQASATSAASSPGAFTLDDAVAVALQGADFEQARLALEKARLGYQQAIAANAASPSPFAEQLARHTFVQAQNQLVDAYHQTVSSTVGAYVDVVAARYGLQAATLQAQNARQARDTARQKAAAGSLGPLELQDAENQLQSTEADLARAQLALDQAMDRLAQALGYPEQMPQADALALPAQLPPVPGITAQQALQKALAASRDVKWRREAVDIAQKQLDQAEAEKASPLELQVQQANLRQAQLAARQAERGVEAAVRGALGQVQVARRGVDVARAQMELEQRRLDGVQQQRKLGLKTDQDVTAAQAAVAKAQQSYANAVKTYLTALVDLHKQLGEAPGWGPAGGLDKLLEEPAS